MKPKTLLNNEELESMERTAPAPKEAPKKKTGFTAEDIETKSPIVITGTEIGRVLNISAFTFRKWVKRGMFKDVRLLKRNKGDTYNYNKADFVEWLNKQFS